ncbi:MAG: hypothetical protein MMC23_009874 [Stictis urceolatum]|nr:hypothetical protein [Stictis urceolata]
MSTLENSTNTKRKPATYGKASRRALLGIQGPSSPSGPPGGNQGPCTQELLVGRVRKTPPADSRIRALGQAKSSISTSARSIVEIGSQASPVTVEGAMGIDLYNVPTSEEDRPAIPAKPTFKRRKIQNQGFDHAAKKVSHSTVLSRRDPEPSPRAGSLSSPDLQDTAKDRNKRFTRVAKAQVKSQRMNCNIQSLHEANENVSTMHVDTPNHQNLSLGARQSKAVELDEVPDATYSNSRGAPINKSHPSHASNDADSRRMASRMATPSTPPQKAGKGKATPSKAMQYLSPSGLDIPGLMINSRISNGPETRHSEKMIHSKPNDVNKVIAERGKMKDKLVMRDGMSRRDDSPSESQESTDETDYLVDDTMANPEASFGYGEHLRQRSPNPVEDGVEVDKPYRNSDRQRQLLHAAGPRLTYAARQRTLRKEECDDDALLNLSLESEAAPPKKRRLELRNTPSNVQSFSDSDSIEDDQPQISTVQTIHELRQAGGNARFSGQIEVILEDVASNKLSLKRSGLLDLEAKLQEANFRSYFVSNGLVGQLSIQSLQTTDVLTKTLLSIALLQLLFHDNSAQTLASLRERPVLMCFRDLVEDDNDVEALSRTRGFNVAKAMQKDIRKSCKNLLRLPIWRCGTPVRVTPRTVSIQCLEYLVRNTREAGATQEILEQDMIDRLIGILSISTNDNVRAKSLQNTIDIQNVLSILESSTLYAQEPDATTEELWSNQSIREVARLLNFIEQWHLEDADRIWNLALRLALNLTTRSPSACRIFASNGVVEPVMVLINTSFAQADSDSSEGQQEATIANLILSLGLLIHLAEVDAANRKLFTVRQGHSATPLGSLLKLFKPRWQRAFEVVSETESKKNVPIGFLSALLCYLSIDPSTRAHVASELDGGSLKYLLIAVYEFLRIYKETEVIGPVDDDTSFVSKLRRVADHLKAETAHLE